MDDWAKNFKSLLNSPFGKEIIRTIEEDLHDTLISKAEDAKDPQTAFGLLKEAKGAINVIDHLRFRSDVPRDGGSKN